MSQEILPCWQRLPWVPANQAGFLWIVNGSLRALRRGLKAVLLHRRSRHDRPIAVRSGREARPAHHQASERCEHWPDEICTAGALNADFIKAGGAVADYEAGMTFAIVNGWVADEGEMIRLLSAGANQGS
jgi:hypothetical protein